MNIIDSFENLIDTAFKQHWVVYALIGIVIFGIYAIFIYK